MLKKHLSVSIAVLIVLCAVFFPFLSIQTVKSDAPTIESWSCGSAEGGLVKVGYHINTVNLQVQDFWIENNSPTSTVILEIKEHNPANWSDYEIIFSFGVSPGYGYMEMPINNFKYHRVPATDPDDPDSIRTPPNVSIGFHN